MLSGHPHLPTTPHPPAPADNTLPVIKTNLFDLSWAFRVAIPDVFRKNPWAAQLPPGAELTDAPCYSGGTRTVTGYWGGDAAFGMVHSGSRGVAGHASAGVCTLRRAQRAVSHKPPADRCPHLPHLVSRRCSLREATSWQGWRGWRAPWLPPASSAHCPTGERSPCSCFVSAVWVSRTMIIERLPACLLSRRHFLGAAPTSRLPTKAL